MTHRTLHELDDAHADQRTRARLRIDLAEQYVHDYRSRVRDVQERFHELAARDGVGDDTGFREELRRTSVIVDEKVARAGRQIAELEDEYDQLLRAQTDERESFLARSAAD
ncbi:hypothetical protein [Leifsonia sp. NPDC077715]|uniref:hypothetical protein n=1 Tax=Leifsonia sp. NPDC077715 TaxID=3155539 RepID=UPI003449A367